MCGVVSAALVRTGGVDGRRRALADCDDWIDRNGGSVAWLFGKMAIWRFGGLAAWSYLGMAVWWLTLARCDGDSQPGNWAVPVPATEVAVLGSSASPFLDGIDAPRTRPYW